MKKKRYSRPDIKPSYNNHLYSVDDNLVEFAKKCMEKMERRESMGDDLSSRVFESDYDSLEK